MGSVERKTCLMCMLNKEIDLLCGNWVVYLFLSRTCIRQVFYDISHFYILLA